MGGVYAKSIIKKELRPYFSAWRDDLEARKDKTFFWPTGTQVYVGMQGSGKTISAVHHLLRLKKRYPEALVVTNLELKVDFPVITFSTMEELGTVLTQVNNGRKGVIYLIDEIHTYFNALDSSSIPPYVFTEISQQRKQRKLIIGTSQLFMRMAKPFREQCDALIHCKTYFGFFTSTHAYDGMTLTQDDDGKLMGSILKKGFFYHTRELRASFDTYQKVISGAVQFAELREVRSGRKTRSVT